MRLSKLHIKGFKSFANDTVVNFNEDVIGIVGPNGAGKSNIVDAMRWVLGEQKGRELRLDKMGDVLFNGTKSRKASGVAQVSLTFDNTKNILPTEYNTVTLSRLLYKSGESEYRLNDVPCRLKDITSLFMDTGIGSNSYAIIALGMVDNILANKHNDRRKMFEQAAGISKYKKRKHETLNKLKNTQNDLERLEDIIFELEGNLKSLKKQADRAEKYLNIKKDYKEKSVYAAKFQIDRISEAQAKIESKLKEQEEKLAEMTTSLSTLEADLEKEKSGNLDKEKELSTFQKDLNDLMNSNRDQEHAKNLLSEKINFNQSRQKEIDQRSERNTKDANDIKQELIGLDERIKNVSQNLSEKKEILRIKEAEYVKINESYQLSKSKFEAFNQERVTKEQAIYELEKNKAIAQNTIDNTKVELDKINHQSRHINGIVEQQVKTQKSLLSEKETLQKSLTKIQDDHRNTKEALQKTRDEINLDNEKMAKLVRKLDAKKNEKALLQNMIENLEGYPDSMKYLKSQWTKKPPILADILDVDDSVKKSLEQYLDAYINYYIVDDMADAQHAIGMLTKAQKGKANFFLLNQIQELKPVLAKDPRLKPVLNYLKVEEKFSGLINYLLGQVYVFTGGINDLSTIENINELDIISSKGDFVKTKNTLTGGSIGLFEGSRLGRKKHVKTLIDEIKKLDKEFAQISQGIEKKQASLEELSAQDLSIEIENQSMLFNNKEREIVKINTELESSQNQLKAIAQKQAELTAEIKNKAESINSVEIEMHALKKTYETLMNHKAGGDGLEDEALMVSTLSQDVNQMKIELIREENTENALKKDRDFRNEKLLSIERQLQEDQSQYSILLDESQKAKNDIEVLEQNLSAQYQLTKEKESTLNEVERTYFAARSIIIQKEDAVRHESKKIDQARISIQSLRDKYSNFGFERNAVIDRLSMEFGMELSHVTDVEIPEEMVDHDAVIQKVERLRRQLANFGEINPLALEAYTEMEERYQNMIAQRADIFEAKDSLLITISEIEETAKEKFMESFELVRGHFKNVFRSLFSDEDDCDLVLINSESPLEAEIDIIAKPKGKKPKSLSQLSGGEKTLTATALLFALYLLKPAPFCIFDEVDAPLDDINVQKFINIIKTFSKESQFIIITHNKLTMAEVDVLYGVFMQEQGVSGITAVDFRKYKHDPILTATSN